MEIKIAYVVEVVECSDPACPIEEKYMGKRGIVKEINEDRPSPITVFFEGIGENSFWQEELKVVKIYDFEELGSWKEQFRGLSKEQSIAFYFNFKVEVEKFMSHEVMTSIF